MRELDLAVIILTKDEHLHLTRCLDNIHRIAKEIFLIDSYSADQTLEIAKRYSKVGILRHKWENNHAKQLNWGLDHAPITARWILRLDADEYLLPELVEELERKLPTIPEDVTGLVIKRRHIFMDKWMKHGIYPVKLLRIFRTGKGRCEQRLMDEHIELFEGTTLELENDFCDHNLNNLSWFCHKHVDYAVREAADLLDMELGITGAALADRTKQISEQAVAKRKRKHAYARKPLFWRSFAYFIYRYVVKGGWKDGKEGFVFAFIQGWWYRTLVDAKVYEIKRKCGSDRNRIIELLKSEYGISL